MGQLTPGPHQYAASLVSQGRCYPKPYPCLKEHQLNGIVLMRPQAVNLARTSTDV